MDKPTKQNKHLHWDEIQQTILLVFSFVLWAAFEYMCFSNAEYASAPYTAGIRIVLINLVTNLFTYIYTKSLPPDSKNGGKGGNGDEKYRPGTR